MNDVKLGLSLITFFTMLDASNSPPQSQVGHINELYGWDSRAPLSARSGAEQRLAQGCGADTANTPFDGHLRAKNAGDVRNS
jgi:hypothetical protein